MIGFLLGFQQMWEIPLRRYVENLGEMYYTGNMCDSAYFAT